MRRLFLLAVCAAAAVAGCVSIQGLPDPKGALKPRQRLVVAVYPAPGPWIIGSADTKAEAAAKLSPLGFIVQTAENEHTNSVSKNLQQYLPRPRLGLAVQNSLLESLRAARSSDTVQTALEAGIVPTQLAEWNKSKDQLDWRQRYYAPDPDQPLARDYARILTLDDALILDVNVSFGTSASEVADDNRILPSMSAASRVYRGDTSHLLWEHEDTVVDQVSSATMTDFQMQPWLLTDSLQRLAPALGKTISASFLKAFAVAPPAGAAPPPSTAGGAGGGLVPMSFFQNASTGAPTGLLPSTTTTPGTPGAPTGLSSTTGAPGQPGLRPATPPGIPPSNPDVSVSTPP
jgi:hypothetical protein